MRDGISIPKSDRTVKVLMFTVTEALAVSLFNWCQMMLVLGAAAVLIGTIGAFAMGMAKDQFANERISANETETARARESAAKAELELEKFKAPRSLNDEQFSKIANGLSKFAGQKFRITTFWEMKEPLALSNQIYLALLAAKWDFIKPESATMLLGGQEGIQVWVHPNAGAKVREAADALVDELNDVGMQAVLKEQNPANPPDDKIGLNVGTKP